MRPGRNGTLSCGERYKIVFFFIESVSILLFTIDYLLRLYAAPSRMKFLRSALSVIDLFVIVPYYISLFSSDNDSSYFGIFRVFLLLKFSRHSRGLGILGYMLRSCASELAFLIITLATASMIFATLMFYAEKNVDGTNFNSIPSSLWYVFGAMTTVGSNGMVN